MKFPHSLDQSQMEVIYGRDTLSSEKNISTTLHFIINHHLRTSTVEGSVFHFIQKLGEFLQLGGSLSEAVG